MLSSAKNWSTTHQLSTGVVGTHALERAKLVVRDWSRNLTRCGSGAKSIVRAGQAARRLDHTTQRKRNDGLYKDLQEFVLVGLLGCWVARNLLPNQLWGERGGGALGTATASSSAWHASLFQSLAPTPTRISQLPTLRAVNPPSPPPTPPPPSSAVGLAASHNIPISPSTTTLARRF